MARISLLLLSIVLLATSPALADDSDNHQQSKKSRNLRTQWISKHMLGIAALGGVAGVGMAAYSQKSSEKKHKKLQKQQAKQVGEQNKQQVEQEKAHLNARSEETKIIQDREYNTQSQQLKLDGANAEMQMERDHNEIYNNAREKMLTELREYEVQCLARVKAGMPVKAPSSDSGNSYGSPAHNPVSENIPNGDAQTNAAISAMPAPSAVNQPPAYQ